MDSLQETPFNTTGSLESGNRRWPGLSPFRVEEGDRFFGRDDEIAELARLFERPKSGQNALVWLHGPPGVGKTSLVMAGLIPRLHKSWGNDIGTLLLAPEGDESGRGLIEEIAESILSISPTEASTSRSARLRQFELLLEEDQAEAAEFLAACYRKTGEADAKQRGNSVCLLVLDDIEKMAPAAHRYLLPTDDTNWIHNELGAVLSFLHLLTMTGAFPVMVTMGSQSLPVIQQALTAVEKPNFGSWVELNQLSPKDLRPFFASSPEVDEAHQVTVSNELFDVIVLDSKRQPAVLPFISEALRDRCLREPDAAQLTIGDHEAGSGMGKKFAEVAQAVFEMLPSEAQAQLPKMMMLLRPNTGKGEFTKCRYRDLAEQGEDMLTLVNALITGRVLQLTGTSAEESKVSFAIPAAVPQWTAAKDWLEQDAFFADQVDEFRERLDLWNSHHQTPVYLIHAPKALARANEILEYHRSRPFLDPGIVDYFEQSMAMSSELDTLQSEIRMKRALIVGGATLLLLILIAGGVYLLLK